MQDFLMKRTNAAKCSKLSVLASASLDLYEGLTNYESLNIIIKTIQPWNEYLFRQHVSNNQFCEGTEN